MMLLKTIELQIVKLQIQNDNLQKSATNAANMAIFRLCGNSSLASISVQPVSENVSCRKIKDQISVDFLLMSPNFNTNVVQHHLISVRYVNFS